jgi:hypothetical protein
LQIKFKLRDIDRIEPWGSAESRSLSWFRLTDGAYCIETPAGCLLGRPEIDAPDLGVPWLDYQVVRLFEDLEEIWPYVREPVPADILARYFAWRPGESAWLDGADPAQKEAWSCATGWWWTKRSVDFAYLREPPQLHLWRSQSAAHLEWLGAGPWWPPSLSLTYPFEVLQEAVVTFYRDLLGEMSQRVMKIERSGWQPVGGRLDIPHLVREQEQRERDAELALKNVAESDWMLVREALDQIGA